MRAVTVLEPLALLIAAATATNVVEIGLQRLRPGQSGLPHSLTSRAASSSGTYIQNLVNNVTGGGYYANVTVGTPPQPQLLVVDTGSSDVWVVASDANLCTSVEVQEENGDSCGETYDPTKSSTYKLVDADGFSITYLDGTGSSGDYITDTFDIGGAAIKSLQMGYATETIRGTGVIGVSYAASESTLDTYPNLLSQFQAQGLISTMAFSLYLNDFRSQSGSILFGGVDTGKFIGELSVMPVLQTQQDGVASYSVLAVALNSMTAASGSSTSIPITFSGRVPAILDSGTTLSYLPSDIASELFNAVGAYTDDVETGYTFIDCNNSSDLSVTFSLGTDATITVPASQIVLDVFADVQDEIPPNVPFADACLFGFQDLGVSSSSVTTSAYALLGDTFLRSTYAVYDLTNNEIALAPANLNSTTSNIVELQASDSGIPTLTGVKSQETFATTAASSTKTSSSTKTTGLTKTTTSGSSDGSSDGGTVTVTASPKASSSDGGLSSRGPSYGVLAAAGAACLFSFLGGALFMT